MDIYAVSGIPARLLSRLREHPQLACFYHTLNDDRYIAMQRILLHIMLGNSVTHDTLEYVRLVHEKVERSITLAHYEAWLGCFEAAMLDVGIEAGSARGLCGAVDHLFRDKILTSAAAAACQLQNGASTAKNEGVFMRFTSSCCSCYSKARQDVRCIMTHSCSGDLGGAALTRSASCPAALRIRKTDGNGRRLESSQESTGPQNAAAHTPL